MPSSRKTTSSPQLNEPRVDNEAVVGPVIRKVTQHYRRVACAMDESRDDHPVVQTLKADPEVGDVDDGLTV